MADELGLPTVGWSLDDVAAEDTGWGVFRVEPVRVLTRRGVSGPADAVRFAAAEDMCSGHANGRTAKVRPKATTRRQTHRWVGGGSKSELAGKKVKKKPGCDPGTAECFMRVARGRRLGADRTSRKGQPEVLPAARLAGRLRTVAGSPREPPGHSCCRRLGCACHRPQAMASTTSTAASGRGFPCWRACRYVAEAAAWFGGLPGRLRANRPVYGSCRLLIW